MQTDLKLSDESLQLTMLQLLERYTGPNAPPIPPELAGWVSAAVKWAEVLELHLRNNIAEAEQKLARLAALRAR
ncbi:MAG TPA: hypothetical protein VFU02_17685 [Polyangiaceae bacterium]|nr:hypothetical protein [Polyangiaceae bacterium]